MDQPLPSVSDVPVYDIYIAARKSALLTLAVHLGFFDALGVENGDISAEEVMTKYNLIDRGADALLVGLHSLELVTVSVPSQTFLQTRYKLTEQASLYLVKTSPYYLGNLIAAEWENFITPQSLYNAMKTGKPQVYGVDDPWAEHDKDDQKTIAFTAAMHSISIRPALGLTDKFVEEYQKRKCLLDVGAGSGVFPIVALTRCKHLHAVIFEIPAVVPICKDYLKKYNVIDRANVLPGNMFNDEYPKFYSDSETKEQIRVDMILYSQILHDWPRDKGVELLKKAHQTLDDGGIVMIHEKLLNDERDGPVANAMVSLGMLFWTEGQQYSGAELESMLTEVGFKEPKRIATVGLWSLVYATK
eukprot:TRINITY_DN2078_c0_g1_i1.p1 TRINITY_DN2078_c0_g1~~TRINITY_DN2078_c0_g1_i1.p1  ORF type:complete len:371 (-),score=68.21 TRINITY_DN2078_c0_g1_i1:4-1080(-)